MAKAKISPRNERILHSKCGNMCAMCKTHLTDLKGNKQICIGENAHIYGEKETAARYNKDLSDEYVNSEENLIFLCANCHTKIDKNEKDFPAELLHEIKKEHENWVFESLNRANMQFGFAELEVLAKFLLQEEKLYCNNYDYNIISVSEKIDKNSLSSVAGQIKMGLSRCNTIEQYFNRNPDATFATRLTYIMTKKYKDLKNICDDNLELFNLLWDFASGNNIDFNYRAAGLAIVSYFFEKCEVFEK